MKVELRLAWARIELADWSGAAVAVTEVEAADPRDWRAHWSRGVVCLERGQPADARSAFAAVYQALPGELAPKLALGLSTNSTAGRARRHVGMRSSREPIRRSRARRSASLAACS